MLTSLGGTHHLVELLTDDEALRLLALAVGKELDELPAEARRVIKQCGRLPLAVSLAGGMVAAGLSWTNLLTAFDRHKLEFFKDEHRPEQHQSLWKMIEISVRALDAAEQMRLVELGVFPEDEAVPAKAVATLWQHTGQLDDLDTPALLVKLKQRSLVQLSAGEQNGSDVDRVSLHDLVHDYCLRRAQVEFGKPACLHDLLLAAYRQTCPDGWWTVPNDGYFYSHLRDHLVAAGRENELADLLHELPWLEAKNAAGLAFDLLRDFKAATDALPETDDQHRILRLLDEALRRDIHFIARHSQDYPQGLFQCLWNSCWWYDCPEAAKHYVPPWEPPGTGLHAGLSQLMKHWRESKEKAQSGFVWLRSLRPPEVELGSAQLGVLRGHLKYINSVGYSPDGSRIISGAWDECVRVWDASTGAELHCLRGMAGPVMDVGFTPDAQSCIGASLHDRIHVWDLTSGNEIGCMSLPSPSSVKCVAISPDGRRVVSGDGNFMVRIWHFPTGTEIHCLQGHRGDINSVSFSPCGTIIASASSDQTVRLWNVESGAGIKSIPGHKNWVLSVVFSPDGLSIATGSIDGTVRTWHVQTGKQLQCTHDLGHMASCVKYSPDGRFIVGGLGDGSVRIWDARSMKEIRCFRGHSGTVYSVSVSPDGERIVSGGSDNTIRVWRFHGAGNLENSNRLRGHTIQSRPDCLAFSPVGERFASGASDGVWIWDSSDGTVRGHLDDPEGCVVESVAFAQDGKRLVSGEQNGAVRVWDLDTFATLLHIAIAKDRWERQIDWGAYPLLATDERPIQCVAYAPDGRQIAASSGYPIFGSIFVVVMIDGVRGRELYRLYGHESEVDALTFSPDGQLLISGSSESVRIWDLQSSRIESARSNLLQRVLAFFHIQRKKPAPEVMRWDPTDQVKSVAMTPDQRQIVTGSDESVRIWDVASGACLEVIQGRGDVTSIAAGLPWRALVRGLVTVIEARDDATPIAWFPVALTHVTTHPSGRIWAGITFDYVCLFTLESGTSPTC